MGLPVAVELFCGVGGLTLGFEQAGFEVVVAADWDLMNVNAHRVNFPACDTIQLDVSKATAKDLLRSAALARRPVDVVFGGPPCQGFSVGGQGKANDPRNLLLGHFGRLVRAISPRIFVMENVTGLLGVRGSGFLTPFIQAMNRAGYSILDPWVFDAQHFQVPQRRRRTFLIGYRRRLRPPSPPVPDKSGVVETVWNAIADLPEVEEHEELLKDDVYLGPLGPPTRYSEALREDHVGANRSMADGLSGCRRTQHTLLVRHRFSEVPQGGRDPVSRFYRLHKDGLAFTLRAGTRKDRGSFMAPRPIHPLSSRVITVREAARLQSFPDWFQFEEAKWNAFWQIGNSVPPKLARAVARSIFEVLD